MSASINNVNGDDNVSDDCSSSAGNDTLQYDNDSYHDHVLSCDNGCPDPELSTSLTEKDDDDISDYLAGLVLAISPDD
nr:hypothetical protein BaRGS_023090 [Batillaria attramentaria]